MSATPWRWWWLKPRRPRGTAPEAIEVAYDVLPSVTDLATATDAGQPAVWPGAANNTCFDWEIGDKAQVEALFASAAHVTSLTVINNRVVVNSMEARAALADYADGRWTLHTNTQGGWVIKSLLGKAVFHVPEEQFRVVTPDVGGGFGMKLFLYAEHVLTCYAARKLGRPVKWGERAVGGVLVPTPRAATTSPRLSWRSTRKAISWRCAPITSQGWAPICPPSPP